jgi:hypothetical protein
MQSDSKALAAIIVAYRSLGICRDEAKNAMIELMRRQENGDEFNYENYIKEKLLSLPKTTLDNNVMQTLSTLSSIGIYKI